MNITIQVATPEGEVLTEQVILNDTSWDKFTLQEAATLEAELGADELAQLLGLDADTLADTVKRSPLTLRAMLYAKVRSSCSPRVRPHLDIDSFDLELDAINLGG